LTSKRTLSQTTCCAMAKYEKVSLTENLEEVEEDSDVVTSAFNMASLETAGAAEIADDEVLETNVFNDDEDPGNDGAFDIESTEPATAKCKDCDKPRKRCCCRMVGRCILIAGDLACNSTGPMSWMPCLLYGPDWPTNIYTHILVIGPFTAFALSTLPQYGMVVHAIGYFLLIGTLGSLFIVSSQDPGIEGEPDRQRSLADLDTGLEGTICTKCHVFKSRLKNVVHCHDCGICVYGYDHHCPWMGKCIGGRTQRAFYSFLFFVFTLLIYVMIAVISLPHSATRKAKYGG